MKHRERSGTDEQIASRIRRGDHGRAIRDELGCGDARIRKVAALHGLTVACAHTYARMDDGEIVLKAQTTQRKRPSVRLTLPVGWDEVRVTYPTSDVEEITIRKVNHG